MWPYKKIIAASLAMLALLSVQCFAEEKKSCPICALSDDLGKFSVEPTPTNWTMGIGEEILSITEEGDIFLRGKKIGHDEAIKKLFKQDNVGLFKMEGQK